MKQEIIPGSIWVDSKGEIFLCTGKNGFFQDWCSNAFGEDAKKNYRILRRRITSFEYVGMID